MKSRWFLLGMLVAAVSAAGCATDVGTIDRTQAEKLEKKIFAGIWYMNQTVIDIAQTGAASFVGETQFGAIPKVVWEVSEDALIAYPTNEYIEGAEEGWHSKKIFRYWDEDCTTTESEDHQCVDGVDNLGDPSILCCFIDIYVGQPVAAFQIKSHFDVQRRYNAQTGSETNVIEENTTDKKWFQRKWMRVNWAQNMISDFQFMARIATQSPLDYYVQSVDDDNPDAPTFTDDYFDVVTKVYTEPESTGGCDIYGLSTGDCAPTVIKFRTAFRKVDHIVNYEPKRYDNEDEATLFGYFLTQRNAYDPDYGINKMGAVSLINRWNLWQDSFDETETDKPCFKDSADTGCDTENVNGVKEFCKADGWFQHGSCVELKSKPYSQRGLRPIVYHHSVALPETLWPATELMVNSWSDAFKETIAWLYLWEEKGLIRGQENSLECDTDADCAGHAVTEDWIDLNAVQDNPFGYPDYPYRTTLSCETKDDCVSETCIEGMCHSPLLTSFAKTTVIRETGSITVPDWTDVAGNNRKLVMDIEDPITGKYVKGCAVRFLNISETSADLTVDGTTLFTAIAPLTGESFDPMNPGYQRILPTALSTFEVAGASAKSACEGNAIVLVVYTGDSVYTASAAKADVTGLRIVNATAQTVDLSVNGALWQPNFRPGANTGYRYLGGGGNGTNLPADYTPHRILSVPAGSRGDVTCYRHEQVSRCVGYQSEITDADLERWLDIKEQLPEMMVLCHNSYLPATDEDNQNDDKWTSKVYAPWIEVKDKDILTHDGKALNPCLDFEFSADKMTAEEKLAQAQGMKKIGDSRYNLVNWVSETQYSSPLGYGPSATNDDTGEIFWAAANIYGAYLDYYKNFYRDLFDLITGKLETADYITGKQVRDFVLEGMDEMQVSDSIQPTAIPAMANMQNGLANLPAGVELPNISEHVPTDTAEHEHISPMEIYGTIHQLVQAKDLDESMPKMDIHYGKNRLSAVKGTWIEQMLMNQEMQYAADENPNAAASPVDWATIDDFVANERERQTFLSNHNYCKADFNDEGMIGMVKSWACLPGDSRPVCDDTFNPLDARNNTGNPCCINEGDALADAIVARYYAAVVEHEVGHTVGLRHNFVASSDAFNAYDPYYDIREREAVPCLSDDTCDQIRGQHCEDGFCHMAKIETCSTASDCGFRVNDASAATPEVLYMDHFDCIEGRCIEVDRCGMHGECPTGSHCNGDDMRCYWDSDDNGIDDNTNLIYGFVENPDDTTVKQFIPRAHLTDKEIENSRTVYQVTSLMDYGQRWHSDILDLGKYDYAVIKFGYGGLIDIFTKTDHVHQLIHQGKQLYGNLNDASNSDNFDSGFWNYGVYFSQFYFMENIMGVDAIRFHQGVKHGNDGEVYDYHDEPAKYWKNRVAIPYENVKYENLMTENFYRTYIDRTRIIAPYKYSSDEYRGNVGNYTWDTGADQLEIIHNMKINMQEYYLTDAFKRERYGFGLGANPMSYMARLYGRFIDPMRGAAMYYALYAHLLKNYSWRGLWSNGRMMGWSLRRSSELGFEILANSIASPAPGSFKLDVDNNIYRNFNFESGAEGSDLDVGLGEGKYPYTTFWDGAGYYYWDHAAYFGSFWEKLVSLIALTDSTVYFTSNYVGEQLDLGVGTSLGFNTMYPRQLSELFGAFVVGDEKQVGRPVETVPVIDYLAQLEDGVYPIKKDPITGADMYETRVIDRPWFDKDNALGNSSEIVAAFSTPVTAPAGPVVEPSITNMTLKLYLMLYGMAFLPASFDPAFLDTFAICIKGNGNCYEVSSEAGFDTDEFTDPFSGKTFQVWAPKYQSDWYSANTKLVEKANAQKTAWENAAEEDRAALKTELMQTVEVLDLMRNLYETYNEMTI